MCRKLVSCADFKPILTPFIEADLKPLLLLLKGMERQDYSIDPSLARRHSTNRFLLKRKSPESQ